MAELVGHVYYPGGTYVWVPGTEADPSGGAAQPGTGNQSMEHHLVGVGSLKARFDGVMPSTPHYIVVTQQPGHTYVGDAGDPYPVWKDPTPDMYYGYQWYSWWGDAILLKISLYRDVFNEDVYADAGYTTLPTGVYNALGGWGPPGILPEPSQVGNPYAVVVNSHVAGPAEFDVTIGSGRYMNADAAVLGNLAMSLPTITFGGAQWDSPWPYDDPSVEHGQLALSAIRLSA